MHIDFHAVENFTHPDVVARIAQSANMEARDAQVLFDELKIFLAISAIPSAGGYTPYYPSKLIDLAWHEFILFTKDYRQFCLETLGVFVDHRPGIVNGAISGDALAKRMRHFSGTHPKFIGNHVGADCVSCWGQPHPDDADCANDPKEISVMRATSDHLAPIALTH